MQLGGRPHAPERIVLVHTGHAEDGHDRVADELLDRAAVTLDHLARRVVEPGEHPTDRLGVEPLADRRRTFEVGEEHGDHAPGLMGSVERDERCSARHAEPRPIGIPFTTQPADLHAMHDTREVDGSEPATSRRPQRKVRLGGRQNDTVRVGQLTAG